MKNTNGKNGLKHENILGVDITSTQKERVLRFIRSRLAKSAKFLITTPNPEIVLKAAGDEQFRHILNASHLALADGIGLSAAHKFLNLKAPKNIILRLPALMFQGILIGLSVLINRSWLSQDLVLIKGREMFTDLIFLANKKRLKVFLLGGGENVSGKARDALRISYKKVKIESAAGPVLNENVEPVDKDNVLVEKDLIKKINDFKPHLLFVGFGAPKQEKWIYKHLKELDIGGAMVVGGTFDFISGKTRLPPKWMEKVGLEWLWRLFTKPGHIKRVFDATIVFPYRVFHHKLLQKDQKNHGLR